MICYSVVPNTKLEDVMTFRISEFYQFFNFQPSSKVQLKLQPAKKSVTVEKTAWKIDDDEDDELIDESTLVDPTEKLSNSSVAARK